MSLDDFTKVASIAQNLAVALAVLVGGGWAVFQFLSLRTVAKARLELEAATLALEQRGTLNIRMTCRSIASPGAHTPGLLCRVRITNVGNRTEVIDWSNSRLVAYPVSPGETQATVDGATAIQAVGRHSVDLLSSSHHPGEEAEFPFLLVVPQPGMYLVVFYGHGSPVERADTMADHVAAGITPDTIVWGASCFAEAVGGAA